MTKKDRELIYNLFDGKCGYCGCELKKGWHVDHIKPVRRIFQSAKMSNPENDVLENYMPSCPSCNILKGSCDLEIFRDLIKNFIVSLNRDSTQYKTAKRYGLINETQNDVLFYFEKHLLEHG